ncbi:IS110 family RNA-guided transposase [Geosporobacter ferrireducens]|uniref:Uncharacterized protein n=1 Tax=Geosporobacter ferrireducens TaxID=1424294 RepID=A0A1D8GEP6_9FIRM|nr:IS110 family transposase [Geosporobacter ferrireducens]AOT69391.1 hypothetical protein Gferi_07280 [Geosporobacter ferrireducens]AOT70581.1 hypothetical protein Gferi_13965 [Geosporobacter ferrireducens]AOT71952.1 hypothetical protein Gferi_21870 [Geosporobacter ferrireducens]
MKGEFPVIGADVAKDFCYYAALSPTGETYLKPFKALNTGEGLASVINQIEKVEKAFNRKPVIVLESTGHYSNRLVHFFTRHNLKVYLINPLLSHSIKNSTVRKVKTDKVDAEELAKMYFFMNLKEHQMQDEYLENLKILTRTHYHLSEQRVSVMNQLKAAIEQVMPGFTKVFKSISCKTSLELLVRYPSPTSFLEGTKDDIVQIVRTTSRTSMAYATKKYELILKSAQEGKETGILLTAYEQIIIVYANHLKHINEQLDLIDKKIEALAINIPAIQLLRSIPGIGKNLAPIIAGEIGSIARFQSSKQLVAYCGIDPSVKQSGNFIGTKNKFTKGGSRFIRKALYIAATVAIRQNPNGQYVNKVIYDYYHKKIQIKAKKQALGAVMNKLVRIIFSVLKNENPFVLITPEEQVKMHRSNVKIVA